MAKIDINRASVETLRRLAEAYEYSRDPRGSSKRETRLEDAYRQLHAECEVKLRTRAEVDAEIANVIRAYHSRYIPHLHVAFAQLGNDEVKALCRLCAEPVAETPEQADEPDSVTELTEARAWIAELEKELARRAGWKG